ncbi:MAG: N-6 DNA methylase [Planctomycetes bacterium]|nr:N-6 DNA methylase [Planctomycetota bacterium]
MAIPKSTPWGLRAVVRDLDGRAVELIERGSRPMSASLKNARHRALGKFYTPEWLARWIVERVLPDQLSTNVASRILDPACGDGAFVLAVLNWMAAQRGVTVGDIAQRRQIVRSHVFGVDADPPAIAALRQRVADWIGDTAGHPETESVLTANFQCGDALLGPDWCHPLGDATSTDPQSRMKETVRPLDWPGSFPQVAAAGGFDLVIGNPPYRRELNAKQDFDQIALSELGRRWRSARMDLWHYFAHRGLDLLKPGGRLAFIVNSYWTSSSAARPLRQRLAGETTVEELVLLGPARLFRNVSGRHMIFRVRKDVDLQAECQVLDLSQLAGEQIEAAFSKSSMTMSDIRTVPQQDLWTGGTLRMEAAPQSLPHRGPLLGEWFDVRQGMAENPPFVTKAAALELGDERLVGQGVFVLTAEEVAALQLSEQELTLLRPYYGLSTIGRFRVTNEPSHQVLYLTRRSAPELAGLSRISQHLERFRRVLERRREVRSGQIAWWHLHWPREERLFTAPRVLCHQMGAEPRFAFAERPTYVGFSMHLIVARPSGIISPVTLPALAAILNSAVGKHWFETHAKRRGAHLDISGTVLKQFPLPCNPPLAELKDLERIALNWSASTVAETELNRLVQAIYQEN